MATRYVKTTFYRGGTSRGLLFFSRSLAKFDVATRNKIICSAIGSPDPDGRQIDGVGAGVSSTSKTAIISRAGDPWDLALRKAGHPLPGLPWIDEEPEKVKSISDAVYRFGQVAIKEESIDWGSTCGNMVSAAAHHVFRSGFLSSEHYAGLPEVTKDIQIFEKEFERAREDPRSVVVRLLAHDSGKVVRVRLPISPVLSARGPLWAPLDEGSARIAGVPGTAAAILVETPLDQAGVLSTGRERDSIEVDGEKIKVSIVDTGLPVIFVSADSIGATTESLLEHPASIDANRTLMDKLERIRHAASQLTPALQSKFSPPAPKICVVHPPVGYKTTGGEEVQAEETDLLIRTVSVGQLHRTIPATTLSALAAAQCFPDSIVSHVVAQARQSRQDVPVPSTQAAIDELSRNGALPSRIRAITVGQPAGPSTASVQTTVDGAPESIVMLRTARCIFMGTYPTPSGLDVDESLAKVLEQIPPAENVLDLDLRGKRGRSYRRPRRKTLQDHFENRSENTSEDNEHAHNPVQTSYNVRAHPLT